MPNAQSLGSTLAKLNNVVLEGMNGWRLQKVGLESHSVKWCVMPGPTGLPGAVSHQPGDSNLAGDLGASGLSGAVSHRPGVEQIKSEPQTGEPTVG